MCSFRLLFQGLSEYNFWFWKSLIMIWQIFIYTTMFSSFETHIIILFDKWITQWSINCVTFHQTKKQHASFLKHQVAAVSLSERLKRFIFQVQIGWSWDSSNIHCGITGPCFLPADIHYCALTWQMHNIQTASLPCDGYSSPTSSLLEWLPYTSEGMTPLLLLHF